MWGSNFFFFFVVVVVVADFHVERGRCVVPCMCAA